MGFYDLSKSERVAVVTEIFDKLLLAIKRKKFDKTTPFFCHEDTYYRKATYESIGKIYKTHPELLASVLALILVMYQNDDYKARQTAVNAAGEIGKTNFESVSSIFDTALFDVHHSPRNAVIGSIKKMGEVNPIPVLEWCKKYLHHPDKEIRREICHGIELRGRKHPMDILPLLKELQHDKTKRVYNTLVHVIGQIAYKKGCLEQVINEIKNWDNLQLIEDSIAEIIDVHNRYRNFSYYTQEEAKIIIAKLWE